MAKINQLKAGAVLSYLQIAVRIIVGIVYTPIMLKLLGKSEYGLYNTVSSTISMLSILNLGFNSSYIRYYAKYYKDDDKESIAKLNGLFLIIFSIIGLVGLICGLLLSFNLSYVFGTGLTSGEYGIAKILMLLLTFNLAMSFPMSVFSTIISAQERFVFLKLLGIINAVLTPIATLILLLMGFGSIGMVAVTVAVSLIFDAIYLVYVFKVLKSKFIFRGFERGLFKSLFNYTAFIAMNLIIDQINWNIDKFLLGRFKGTGAVAIYSVGYSLYNYYMMFSVGISGVFTPKIHKIINNTKDDMSQQKAQLTDLFVKVGRIQFLVMGLLSSGVIIFGKPFIHYWAGSGYEESYYVAILLILPASIALLQNIGIEIQRAENRHQFRSIVYLVMALLNLISSIFLCQLYGAIGSVIGTAVSLIIGNGLIMNIYYQKRCNIDVLIFWKNILRMGLSLLIPIVFGVICISFFDLYSIWQLLCSIAGYTVIYVGSMWCISMNRYEKELITKFLGKITKKK